MQEKDLEKLVEVQLELFESSPKSLIKQSQQIELKILKEVATLLESLERKNGIIVSNLGNYKKLTEISTKLGKFIKAQTKSGNAAYLSELSEAIQINEDIYKNFGTIDKAANVAYKEALTSNILANINQADEVFISQIRNITFNAIASQSSYKDALNSLSAFIETNPEKLGGLSSQISRIAWDSFTQGVRGNADVISSQIKGIRYKYTGVVVENTRKFCKDNVGKIFTEAEIKELSKKKWDGKDPTTTPENMKIKCGGYNCNHIFVPTLRKK